MRFLFIVSGQGVPSTRFRILPYLPLLEAQGHRCDVAYSFPQKYDYFPAIGWRLSQLLKRSVRHWHSILASLRTYDSIVIEREVFDDDTWNIERSLRRKTKRLVLDVDDGIFLLHPEKFDQIARLCDVAIAGNTYLRDYLKERSPRVEQIPTCVSLADYPIQPRKAESSERPTVGWIGTTHNVAFLQVAAEALRALAEHNNYRLLVVATTNERLAEIDLSGVHVEFRAWSPETELRDLQDMDLGLMPLPDGQEWMKYKCGLKLIQYLAVGIPGIASPIGVNAEILSGESVGLAARNSTEWLDSLLELIQNPQKRREMGDRGRRLVEEAYSIEGNFRKFESILCGN